MELWSLFQIQPHFWQISLTWHTQVVHPGRLLWQRSKFCVLQSSENTKITVSEKQQISHYLIRIKKNHNLQNCGYKNHPRDSGLATPYTTSSTNKRHLSCVRTPLKNFMWWQLGNSCRCVRGNGSHKHPECPLWSVNFSTALECGLFQLQSKSM